MFFVADRPRHKLSPQGHAIKTETSEKRRHPRSGLERSKHGTGTGETDDNEKLTHAAWSPTVDTCQVVALGK